MNTWKLNAIKIEVESSFTNDELANFKNFNDFFKVIDIQNGYEENWNPKLWKKYYKKIWDEKRGLYEK